MSITDEAVKIIGSFKPIDIKTEIKNPSVAPVVNYSPTNNNNTFNFQSVEINNTQLNSIADKVTENIIEDLKTQIVGNIASNPELQTQLSKLSHNQLPSYLKTAMVGNATLSEVQPNFITAGTTVFPDAESLFKAGYETGVQGKRINNVKIIQNSDESITIQYDEY